MQLKNLVFNIFLNLLILIITLKSVNSIVIPRSKIIIRHENRMNRKLIDITTKLSTNQMKNIKTILPCFESFIKIYMSQQPKRITVVFTKNHQNLVVYEYLNLLQKIRSTYVLTEDINVSGQQNTSLDVIIILNNHKDLEKSIIKFNELCGRECRYAVLLNNIFSSNNSFLEESKLLIDILWLRKTSNVVIISLVNNVVVAAESQSFKSNILRTPMKPIIIGKCNNNNNGAWKTSSKQFFSPMKLNNCIVNIGYFDNEPYVHEIIENNKSKIVGLEGRVIHAIAKSLNFKINTIVIGTDNDTITQDYIENELQNNNSIDLVIGGIVWEPSDSIDFTQAYEMLKVVLLIPVQNDISFRGLISPLNNNVWYAIIGVLIFSVIMKFLLFKKMSFLEIFAIIIGTAWNKQPKILSYRIKFISWIIFGYILSQFYLASLAGRLMAPSDFKIDTMEDFVNSNIKIGGLKSHKKLFQSFDGIFNEIKATDDLRIILNRFITFKYDDYKKKLQDLNYGKNNSLALVAMLNASSINTTFNDKYVHQMHEELTSYPIGFPTWRGLPYLLQIERKLEGLIQGGIISYMGQQSSPKHHYSQANDEEEDYIENNYIRLHDLAPGFLLLIIGCAAGFICLILEFIIYKLNKRKIYRNIKIRKYKKRHMI